MDINAKKAEFCMAYIQAIAAQIGLNPSVDRVDNDSVDLRLTAKNIDVQGRQLRNPQIEIQLKCTSQDVVKGGDLKFKLPKKNYNDLRGDDLTSARYLMVLIVPNNPDNWVTINNDSMTLSNSCYWMSLRFHPEIKNDANVTVTIPTTQKVTCDSLFGLLVKASRREFI